MKKNKLFIASMITTVFGVMGILVGMSNLRIDLIVFYASVLLVGLGLFFLDKEKQLKCQMQQAPFQPYATTKLKNKKLKNWQILFIVATVVFIIALMIPQPKDEDENYIESDSQTVSATEIVTEEPTEAPTEALTEAITEPITEAPTAPPTEPVTEPPTEPATEPITESITEPVTEKTNTDYNTYENIGQQTVTEYVLNTSTMKIHHSYCHSVSKISPENLGYTQDLNWALSSGYEACKKCNP